MSIQDKLNSFIDAQNPKLATFLQHQWKKQQNAVTYKELREAILSGKLSTNYLLQWQQDYSAFVTQHYAPLAEKAIQQAAIDLAAEYGGAVFDPQAATIGSFIKTHGGKLIKEISTDQFTAINTLVRQATLTDTMTVDQLARAIRPCIGLTQRQAATTKRFYDNLIDQGYSPDDALKKQALYAEKMHRRRAFTIAETEMAFAYNAGADAVIEQNIKDGYFQPTVTSRWMTSADERVCDICGKLDNESVPQGTPFSIGVKLPPAHPKCRCAVAYDNIVVVPQAPPQPAQQPTAAAPATAPAQTPDNYTPPSIPDAPELNGMKYKSSTQLGTGEMHQYTDSNGQEWIFKPAQTKGGKPEAFRAYVQEAGYKVQSIVDPQSAVPCGTITLDTPKGKKFGAAQLKLDGLDKNFNLKDWQNGYGGTQPTKEIITQLQRENVTDWLLGNYDSHGGNFILDDATGTLIGVDKEQAFKYIGKAEAKTMSLTFHPNAVYNEADPIYNTLYRKFANADIDIDLNDVLPYIKRVEAVPDAAYREIFRSYAESLHGKGAKAEQLLDEIVSRKQNLRTTYETFYSDLLTQRKGQPMTFQFADNIVTATAQPIQAATMSSKALSGMSLPDLKNIAQKQGIKYAYNMNKTQLIDAISDPTKTQQIVDDAKARAYGIGTTPRKPKPPKPAAAAATAGAKPKVDGITQLSEAMDDFDVALDRANVRGVSLISDKSALEGMQTTLRKVTVDGREAYELSGKLTNPRWIEANKDIILANSDSGSWSFQPVTGKIDYSKPALNFISSGAQRYSIPTRYIKDGDNVLVLTGKNCENDARAMMGEFNIRIFASDGKEAAKKARALLAQVKLDDIVEDVEPISLDRYKKMRLIWQNDPRLADTLDPVKATDADIQGALSKLGITQARVDKARLVKVTDNYFTLIDEANEQIATQKGVAYVWSGVPNRESAASVLESGELMSSTQRLKRGIFGSGASVSRDIETGGADNVFTRIAMQKNVGAERFSDSFASGEYQFLFDKKVLARTDWYAYTSDEFGTTQGSTFTRRHSMADHFDALNKDYRSSNETMFRRSLSLTDLQEIRCRSAAKKKELIDELNARGITKLNGRALNDLIKVGGSL